ncbi:multicopper oxidase family protein [Chroogloeocystis siderophila]|uniref:Bilirubin oxidase n=1 Tax=Chroogloeocystis siderophila 5.2 s.c.1 TaxID=247279 RepID=A0A1U7HM05_9CHRO|nr:multicopper oxidase domain-containing protein [Chroogloeocystis siderophila]OKH24623.1 bilirubin oxidase [Chroogloeocystis siderophila 5.2 s.c.1]
MKITRREALKFSMLAGGSLLIPTGLERISYAQTQPSENIGTRRANSPTLKKFTLPFRTPPVLQPVRSDSQTDYYEITMRKAQVEILPGKLTEIWGYNGITPGPTIMQRTGRQSVVRFINNSLGTPTSTHLHGMASLPEYDGYAEDLTFPGYYKDYYYPNNRAATIWYHDHAIHATARNVYMGLAGMYIIQDQTELDLPLPKGQYDVPLIIQDKEFATNGSLIFDDQGQKSQFGDVILVNGVPWPRMEVARRKYRFRALNGSISRSYRLALNTGDPFIIIGVDGGLTPAPVEVNSFRFGTAERYEFIIDFSKYPIGTRVILKNRSLPNNLDYDGKTNDIMCFDVVRDEADDSSIPSQLRTFTPLLASQAVRTREFRYERTNGQWVINGKTWNANRVDGTPQFGDIEIWRLYNNGGGWFHPIHLHLIDCQILDRNGRKPFPYEVGWKDVFYVGENESVRVIGKFGPNTGKYMQHCHNTVHEDHDMMTQFEVLQNPLALQSGNLGKDPIATARPKPLPAPPL